MNVPLFYIVCLFGHFLMNLLNSFNLIIFLLHLKMEKFIEVKKIDNFVFLQKTITNEQIYKLVKIHSQ